MSLLELKEGDLVVHVTHGIGRYRGLVRMDAGRGRARVPAASTTTTPTSCIVPSDQLDRVQKYIGSDDSRAHPPPPGWRRVVSYQEPGKGARPGDGEGAAGQLYAARQALEGHAFGEDTVWQQEMEAAFPYQETPDQLTAIRDVKQDLEAAAPDGPADLRRRRLRQDGGGHPRRVQGGDGRQAGRGPGARRRCSRSSTSTPSRERLAAFPVKVEMLSRFRTRAEQKKIVEGLRRRHRGHRHRHAPAALEGRRSSRTSAC